MTKRNIDALTTVYAEHFNNLYKLPKAGTPEHKKAYQELRNKLQDNLKTLGIDTNFDFEIVLIGAASKEAAKKQTSAKIVPAKIETKPEPMKTQTPAKVETKNKKPAAAKPESTPKIEAQPTLKKQASTKVETKKDAPKAPKKMLFTKGVFANGKLNGNKPFANGKFS